MHCYTDSDAREARSLAQNDFKPVFADLPKGFGGTALISTWLHDARYRLMAINGIICRAGINVTTQAQRLLFVCPSIKRPHNSAKHSRNDQFVSSSYSSRPFNVD